MYSCEDGFATGGKDGTVKLWDKEFKIVTQLDLASSSTGYKGEYASHDSHMLII